MGLGEGIGFAFADDAPLYDYAYGAFVLEWAEDQEPVVGSALGTTTAGGFSYRGAEVSFADAEAAYLGTLEEIYPTTVEQAGSVDLGAAASVRRSHGPSPRPSVGQRPRRSSRSSRHQLRVRLCGSAASRGYRV